MTGLFSFENESVKCNSKHAKILRRNHETDNLNKGTLFQHK